MSVQVICRTSDGVVTGWTYGTIPAPKPGTVVVTVATPPDLRATRWDGAAGLREATAQEQAAYDDAQRDAREKATFDDQKMIKAVALWAAQKLGVAPATARAEILAIYRSL